MHRILPLPLIVMTWSPTLGQYDSVRVVTNTRTITKADLPEQAVYDNAILLQPATFPGGEGALIAHFTAIMEEPGLANDTVEISFIVETDGSVNEVQVSKGLAPEVDKSILRAALAMPDWKPAIVKERPVRAKVVRTVTIGG